MKFSFLIAALAVAVAPSAVAQTLRVTAFVGSSSVVVADGSTVTVPSDGQDVFVSFSATNAGSTPLRLDQITITGSGSWALLAPPALPATLGPNASVTFSAQFRPLAGVSPTAQLAIRYTQAGQLFSINANLTGALPDFAYFVQTPDGSRTPIAPGSRISFGTTRVGAPQTRTLIVQNRGTVAGRVSSISVVGANFATATTGPVSVPAGQELAIPIVFTAQGPGASSGTVSLAFGPTAVTFGLDGTAASPEFTTVYALRTDSNARPLPSGGRLTFEPTAANTTAVADVIVANQGTGAGTVRSVTLTGGPFQLSGLPLLPAVVPPGEALRFSVNFTPRQLGSFSGTLRIEFEDRTLTATVEGTTSNPEFSFSYIDPATRSAVPVAGGGNIALPRTVVNSSSAYTVVLRNTGPGTGFVNGVGISGTAFVLTDLPQFPVAIPPGSDFRFGVQFTPRTRENQTGTLTIDSPTSPLQFALSGVGIGGELTYEAAVSGEDPVRLPPNAELSFEAAVGQASTRTIRVSNLGNAEFQLTGISISGAGFQLANTPFLPVTIPAGGSQTFAVLFAPGEPGTSRGRLRVGDDTFDLAGTGIAPRLQFQYSSDAGVTPLPEGGAIIVAPARVGESSRAVLSIQNTGTSAVALTTVDISPASGVFTVESLPALPVSLNPGARVDLGVRFRPDTVGVATSSLRVNGSTFTLSASGNQPVSLPAVTVLGPTGTQAPLQQPSVGLTLASPYALPLQGTLNLVFRSEVFTNNPSVQFATGGRSIAFTVPANSTRAVFETGSTEVRLQTGTVAGSIQLVPTFSTLGGLEVTPSVEPSLTLAVERAAPRLLSAEIGARGSTSLTLVVSGYTTTRALRTVQVQITPKSGERFSTTSLTFNVEAASLLWFQGAASEAFGGLFSLTIPLTFNRGVTEDDLTRSIQALTVSVSNEVGQSNAATITP